MYVYDTYLVRTIFFHVDKFASDKASPHKVLSIKT